MFRINTALGATLLLVCGLVHGAGLVDRTVEYNKYLNDIRTGTRNTVTETARIIRDADVGDAQVAKALFEKLSGDLSSLDEKSSPDMKYRNALIMAIASTGAADYAAKLQPICDGIQSKRKPNFCTEAVAEMESNRRKNDLLANSRYYLDGEDPRVGRIMTLLMSDDFAFKSEAAHRMNFGKILDVRLMDAISPQVLQYADVTRHGVSAAQVSAIAGFIKLLGYSGNQKYRDVLEKARKSKGGALITKRAREALQNLDRAAKQAGKNAKKA